MSVLLSLVLLLTLLQPAVVYVHASEGDSFTSQALTINGAPAVWQFTGERPATFGDNTSPSRFEYYSGSALDFELRSVQSGIKPGIYQMSMELFSEQSSTGADAALFAVTSEGTYQTPINYSGSGWESPSSITLNDIIVGEEGELVIGVRMLSSGEHYGYIRNIQLKAGPSVGLAELKPNSALLRPGNTVQLALAVSLAEGQLVSYASSNPSVAAVDEDGLVTAVGDGEAVITATITEAGEAVAAGSSTVMVSSTMQKGYGSIQVEPVSELEDSLRPDFMMGADISTLDALSAIDRKYYDADGVETPLLELLGDNGVNWVRLRTWVDPSDGAGNGYGAGNVDGAAMVRMAAQVKSADMKLLIDLHYSDFWADPGRQTMPKAWMSLSADELEEQVYDYTYETLQLLSDEGVYPDMIQIGNEINGGMLWPLGNSAQKAKPYLAQGIQAVRDFEQANAGEHIDIVIHRANPNDGLARMGSFYRTYSDLDYDVIGISYYPFWHGSLANLQEVMNGLADEFGKKIAVVETSYAYTLEDPIYNGLTGHIFGQAQADTSGYLATAQGQANAVRDVIAAVAAVPDGKGAGIFYWEPGWLLGTDTGWATTHAEDYQGEAIEVDGGSGWANQGLFNFFGEALPSLNVFEAVRASREHYVEPVMLSADDVQIVTSQTSYVAPPSSVKALFSDDTYRQVPVRSWTPSSYDYNTPGQYVLVGELENGRTVEANITVRPLNYVLNPSLEDTDMSAWQLTGSSRSTDAAFTGRYAIHFWNQAEVKAVQHFTSLPSGIYELSAQTRIGIEGDSIADSSVLYAKVGETVYETPLVVTGWDQWKRIAVSDIEVVSGQLEIGVIVNDAIGDYGDFDDWELIRISDLEPEPEPSPSTSPSTEPGATPSPTSDVTPTPSTEPGATPTPTSDVTPTPSTEPGATPSPTSDVTPTPSTEPGATPTPTPTPTPAVTPTPVSPPVGPVLVSTVIDGKTVLTARVSDQASELTISLIELRNKPQGDLIITWGSSTLTITQVELAKLMANSAAGNLTISRNTSDPGTLQMNGAAVTALSAAVQWQVVLKQSDSSQDVTVPFIYSADQSTAQLPSSSIGLYLIKEDGSLQYVGGADEAGKIAALAGTGQSYVIAAVQRDYTDTNEQSDAVRRLTAMGIVQGDPNGALHLQQKASRAEVSKLAVLLMEAVGILTAGAEQSNNAAVGFSDVPVEHWASAYIDRLAASGLLLGHGDGRFAPNDTMTYESLFVLLSRMLDLPIPEPDDSVPSLNASSWAKGSIMAVVSAGLLPDIELEAMDFNSEVTRDDLFELCYRLATYLE